MKSTKNDLLMENIAVDYYVDFNLKHFEICILLEVGLRYHKNAGTHTYQDENVVITTEGQERSNSSVSFHHENCHMFHCVARLSLCSGNPGKRDKAPLPRSNLIREAGGFARLATCGAISREMIAIS